MRGLRIGGGPLRPLELIGPIQRPYMPGTGEDQADALPQNRQQKEHQRRAGALALSEQGGQQGRLEGQEGFKHTIHQKSAQQVSQGDCKN